MDRPRPKFCVGEEVISVCPGLAGRKEVTHIEYVSEVLNDKITGKDEYYAGYLYGLDGSEKEEVDGLYENGNFVVEEELRKIPPEDRTNLISDIWQPKDEEVSA